MKLLRHLSPFVFAMLVALATVRAASLARRQARAIAFPPESSVAHVAVPALTVSEWMACFNSR